MPSKNTFSVSTTTIAPTVATVTTIIFTWIKNGKPDVSMCLNASLAGILVVVVVEALDLKLHIDDPVGAVGVHCANGVWGTLAVGLLANPDAPAGLSGLFYTGSASLLGIQTIGFASIAVYSVAAMRLVFILIEKLTGIRTSPEDEIAGLDSTEHGLPSSYPDFAPSVNKYSSYAPEAGISLVTGEVPAAEAIPVKAVPSFTDGTSPKFTKVEIICKESKFDILKNELSRLGITGMTVAHVLGCGVQGGRTEYYRGVPLETNLLPKVQVDIVVSKVPVRSVIDTAKRVLHTGHYGDGKIFVYDVENVVKIRTGEEGYDALQDEE